MVSTIWTVVTTDTWVSQMVSTTDTGTSNFVSPVYSENPTTTCAPDPSTPVTQHHLTLTEGTKDISTDSTRMETTQNLEMKSGISTQLNYGHSVTESASYTTSEIRNLESSSAAPGNHNTESILSTTPGEDTQEGGSTKMPCLWETLMTAEQMTI